MPSSASLSSSNRRANRSRAIGLALLGLAAMPSLEAATFQNLGFLPGRGYSSSALGISANGTVVIGNSYHNGGMGIEPFRWTPATGIVSLGFFPGSTDDTKALAISANGSVVVGWGASPVYGYETICQWRSAGISAVGAPSIYGSGEARAASADGSAIAGVTRQGNQAFRWTSTSGFQILTPNFPLDPFYGSEANGISADGKVVAGSFHQTSSNQAFIWSETKGFVPLGALPGASASSAEAVSADGNSVVGRVDFQKGTQAVLWTAAGAITSLGTLPGSKFESSAEAVSANGAVVVGSANVPGVPYEAIAIRWDAASGMQSIREILEAYGVDLSDWTLTSANAVSADGTVIVGDGRHGPNEKDEAWIATGVTSLPTGRPVVRIVGKRKLTSTATKITLHGTAQAKGRPLRKVEVKVRTGKYRNAIGRSRWKYTAPLKRGKNQIFIRCLDARGVASKPIEIEVTRK